MSRCINDSFSPCEGCGDCYTEKYETYTDEENNEEYVQVSHDGGRT